MTARIAWYPEIRSDVHFRVKVGVCRDGSYRLVLRSALTNPLTSRSVIFGLAGESLKEVPVDEIAHRPRTQRSREAG